jgi:GNAT superfamily N-acetyltransferase
MSAPILRPAAPEDVDDICNIWNLSFGDDEESVRALLLEIGLISSCVVAVVDGGVRSFMAAFHGLRFGDVAASYLCALCTHPDYRGAGLGEVVCRMAAEQSFAAGAELACLHPASVSLSKWYARSLGMETLPVPSFPPLPSDCGSTPLRPVSPEEYFSLREKSSVGIPLRLLQAQELFTPGSLFALDMGCACVEREEERVLIRELVCPENLRAVAVSAITEHFGAPALFPALDFDSTPHLMGLWKNGTARPFEDAPYLPFTLE